MIDVLLSTTGDGLNITVENGLVALTGGIQTAIVLSMVGGNVADSGDDSTKHLQYWANLDESEPLRTYRCETLFLLNSLPMNTANVSKILAAANRDLVWLLDGGFVSDLTTAGRIVGPKRLEINVDTPQGSIAVQAPWMG